MRIVDILMARDVHTAAKFELLKPEEFGRESGERDILYNRNKSVSYTHLRAHET